MKKFEKYLKESDKYKVLSGNLEKRVEKSVDKIMDNMNNVLSNDYKEVEGGKFDFHFEHKLRETIKQMIVYWLAANGDIENMD